MGNLCSSGAERSEKKEEAQLPDKPRDGEDEALLPKGDETAEVDSAGVQLSVDGEGILGDVAGSKEDAILSDVSRNAEAESQQFASQTQSAFTRIVQSGKDNVDKGVQEVKSEATATAAEISNSAKSTADETVNIAKTVVEEAVTSTKVTVEDAALKTVETVKQKAEESFQSVTNRTDDIVQQGKQQTTASAESVSSGVRNAITTTGNQVSAVQNETENLKGEIEQSVTSVSNNTFSLAQKVAETSSTKVIAAENQLESLSASGIENAKNSAASVSQSVEAAENVADEISTSQSSAEKGLQEQLLEKFDELKSSTLGVTESAKQKAENKVNEATESVKQSVSEAVTSVTEEFSQKLGSVSGSFAGQRQSVTNEVESSKQPAENTAAFVDQSVLVQTAGESLTKRLSAVDDALSSGVHSVKDEASQAVKDVADATASTVDDADNETAEVKANAEDLLTKSISDEVEVIKKGEATKEEVVETSGSEVFENFGESAKGALFSGVEIVKDKVIETVQGLIGGGHQGDSVEDQQVDSTKDQQVDRVENQQVDSVEDQDVPQNDQLTDGASSQAGDSEENFLDKAKSLLEAHRNSIDGSKAMTAFTQDINLNSVDNEDGLETNGAAVGESVLGFANDVLNEATILSQEGSRNDSVEVPESGDNSESTDAAQEATARDFVESIIEKASNLVSESLNTNESVEDDSSASEASVERGEETLEPKKRGVMFVSPQRSEQSSSPLSSPPEFSPPPQVESDLSPPTDSTNSSVSQGELVEKENLPSPPCVPPTFELSTNENNNNNNIVNNNAEDDDESIQRVAMEVTAKAVQDAIKIVTENGTGSFLSNPILSNDLGVSSASSPDNEDEEMTTTDSSQVERGSPVSDITDTSAQGSISESLSSYDPGAVFRQDVANLSDLATSPVDNLFQAENPPAGDFPAAPANVLVNNISDLMSFDENSSSQGNTPTPTNTSSFDTYPPPPLPTSHAANEVQSSADGNPLQHPIYEVPSSLLFDDDFSSSPSKPTIIINSPDSAHHTNGSTEDLSISQTEALI